MTKTLTELVYNYRVALENKSQYYLTTRNRRFDSAQYVELDKQIELAENALRRLFQSVTTNPTRDTLEKFDVGLTFIKVGNAVVTWIFDSKTAVTVFNKELHFVENIDLRAITKSLENKSYAIADRGYEIR